MTGIYIHIPFCKQKCNYCAFASYPGRNEIHLDYVRALGREMELNKNFQAPTLYIGGGTPSVLNRLHLEILFDDIEKNFGPIKNFKESTFEANPESLDSAKIELLKKYGFNRVSLGLQSTHDKHLSTLGRVHNKEMFLAVYNALRAAGFNNINIDIICGVQNQTMQDFEEDIKTVLSLNPEHFSLYGLQIEEGTKLFEQGFNPDQILMRQMLEYAHHTLAAAGYNHYEISNFAKPGYESKHNTSYWQGSEYLGIGSAAAGYTGGVRYSNIEDPMEYIYKINNGRPVREFEESLQGKEKLGEQILIALRQLGGIDYTQEMQKYFGKEIEELIGKNLLESDKEKIKLSFDGMFLSNEVFAYFVAPFE
ncbi:oxygen-independent coproporphyrinogen-3 oxidase [Elusimicrobium simillimum]|uniref:radical SAM family heme chaperone HemW n=1 Tax=Elusimicrobium simillimum TaxID=3143438 RepID=UPI003C6F1375